MREECPPWSYRELDCNAHLSELSLRVDPIPEGGPPRKGWGGMIFVGQLHRWPGARLVVAHR